MHSVTIPAMGRRITPKAFQRPIRCLLQGLLLLSLTLLPACSRVVSMAAGDLADNLSHAIANNDDPETVREGAAAYLLMLDGMIYSDPDNEDLLTKAAALYSTYGAAFVDDPERSRKLSTRALGYAERAVCVHRLDDCGLRQAAYETFEARIQQMVPEDVPVFYTLGASWAGWIQAHKDDLGAVAELSRVEAIMQRIAVLDEGYRHDPANPASSLQLTFTPPQVSAPSARAGSDTVKPSHFLLSWRVRW